MVKRYLVSLIASLTLVFFLLGCGEEKTETTEEDNSTSQQTSNSGNTSSGGSDNSSNNQSPTIGNAPSEIVFAKIIQDPEAAASKDYEEWASEVIETTDRGYVVVARSISWAWPTPSNVDDVLIVKLDEKGNILWNKKIHHRNYDRATSVVEDKDGNYILTGFTSSDDADKSDVLFG